MVDSDPKAKWVRETKARLAKERGEEGSTEEEVKLFSDLQWVWDAFFYLNNRRQFVKGDVALLPQSLSMEAIESYCRLVGITDEDQRIELMRLVDLLDSEWKKDYAVKVEQLRKKLDKPRKAGR